MALPHRDAAVNHYFVRIMDDAINNGFADCSIALVFYSAVLASRFKLRTKDNRSFYNHIGVRTYKENMKFCTYPEETVCFVPHHEPDPCNLPGGRKSFRSFIRRTNCPASAGGKTTGGCFFCVPETEFRQGTQKRQNKGSIYLCPEPGTVSACIS